MGQDFQAAQGGVPREALEYLAAVRKYDEQPGVTRRPRNADIAACHTPPLPSRTWDHRKHDLRDGKWGGRDWIEVWPPPADWHPSWEHLVPLQPHLPEADGLDHVVWEETYDKNGKLVERRLIRGLTHLGMIAASFIAADMSDGKLDMSIHLCKVLAGAARHLA